MGQIRSASSRKPLAQPRVEAKETTGGAAAGVAFNARRALARVETQGGDGARVQAPLGSAAMLDTQRVREIDELVERAKGVAQG